MAIYPNSAEGRRRNGEFNDPLDAQAQGLTRYAEGPGATGAQKWNNARAGVFDTAIGMFSPTGSYSGNMDGLRKERFTANDTALRAPSKPDFSDVQGTPAPRARTANDKFESARRRMGAQAPGVGNVDLGAGAGYGGGGLKRNSLASSIGKFGEPVYDNASISRMMARDAGPGGWNDKDYGAAQEATRILQRRSGAQGAPPAMSSSGATSDGSRGGGGAGGASGQSGDSFGGYGGFRGQGGDPQARDIRGDLRGADGERKGAIENLDLAIKTLTSENGGLNMRSKRDLYGQLLRQRSEMSGMPYEVQNERDLKGAQMTNDMASRNADRGLDREKLGWEQDKFGMERRDRQAAANAPMSIKDQLELRVLDANARRAEDEYAIGRDAKLDDGFNSTVEMYKKLNPNASYEEAVNAAMENASQGSGPVAPAMRAVQRQKGDRLVQGLNEGTNFLDDFFAGNARAPFSQNKLAPGEAGRLTENDVEYTPTGGMLGWANRMRGNPTYDVTPRGKANDDRAARTRVSASEAESALRRRNMDAERRKRAERGE